MTSFFLHTLAVTALVGLLATSATFAAPVAAPASFEAKLTPSQFVNSVLREFLPAPTVDELEVQARKVAFDLNDELYRELPDSGSKTQYREAPAAFQNWLEQTLQQGSNALSAYGNDYRLAANEFQAIKTAIDGLSKLNFSKAQVGFVVNFLRTYFTAENPSMKPNDILAALKHALAGVKNNKNRTEEVSEGEKRAAQFRESIMADVGAAVDETVTIAAAIEGAVVAGGTAALEASAGFLGTIMNALNKINDIPEPILMVLGIAFPPLNTIIHGVQALTCFYDARGAWSFQSWAAWSPWMYCNADLIKLLPVGSEIKMGLGLLFKVLSKGISMIPSSSATG